MNQITILFDILTTSIFAGLIATGVMTAFVYAAHRVGLTSIGMVDAVGSTITGSINKSSFQVGVMLHIAAGITFAMLYTLLFYLTPLGSLRELFVPIAASVGAAHGFVVFFILVPLLAEHHPIRSIREDGTKMALVYFFAHILFGLSLGICLTLSPLFS